MATSQLSDFINYIRKTNIARTNRFRVTFAIPDALAQGGSASGGTASAAGSLGSTSGIAGLSSGVDPSAYMKMVGESVSQLKTVTSSLSTQNPSNIVSMTCLMIDIPGRQEQVTEISYSNFPRKIVNGRTYSEVGTTFLVTGQYAEKKFFDDWFNIINDETNHAVEFYDNYIGTITVECLDLQDQVVYMFQLMEAFPVSMGSIRLDRTAQNQQMVLDVQWAFQRISFGDGSGNVTDPQAGNGIPASAIPGVGSGKNRLFPIPGLDSFSDAVKGAVNTVKGFNEQLQGVLNVAKDVREQVRDAKMQVLDGVKTINGTIKDFKAIAHVPTDVKNEVVGVLNDTKNQLGSLTSDLKNFKNYPTR